MDSYYNPMYDILENDIKSKNIDIQKVLNEQNQQYGSYNWYPLLEGNTPSSIFIKLEEDDIKLFTENKDEEHLQKYKTQVEKLIDQGYYFMKTTHVSAHAHKAIKTWEDFVEQITNPRVVSSFRNYKCKYLMFRKWQEMNLEARIYVYKSKIRYMEIYRDRNNEFTEPKKMFIQMRDFVQNIVIQKLKDKYDDFTVDLYYSPDNDQKWQIVEINSPFLVKM